MSCPPEIAEPLLKILQKGLLLIRQRGWGGDAETAAKVADHMHDIPLILADYHEGMLAYYWQAMRPSLEGTNLSGLFAEEWKRLKPHAEKASLSPKPSAG